jgi:hypothetical protein
MSHNIGMCDILNEGCCLTPNICPGLEGIIPIGQGFYLPANLGWIANRALRGVYERDQNPV